MSDPFAIIRAPRWHYAALLLLWATAAPAMDPDLHEKITHQALAYYRQCSATVELPPLPDATDFWGNPMADRLAEFSGGEDLWPLTFRARNWHFYDASGATESRLGLLAVETSLDRAFRSRTAQTTDALAKGAMEEFYQYAGRSLHYIQDMAVPAHVAPIYHVNIPLIDEQPDPFDSLIDPDTLYHSMPPARCRALAAKAAALPKDLATGLRMLLDSLALETRAAIASGNAAPVDWSLFWRLYDPAQPTPNSTDLPGFGRYGAYGREGFALDAEHCQQASSALNQATQNPCLALLSDRLQAAIDSSLIAIIYLQLSASNHLSITEAHIDMTNHD